MMQHEANTPKTGNLLDTNTCKLIKFARDSAGQHVTVQKERFQIFQAAQRRRDCARYLVVMQVEELQLGQSIAYPQMDIAFAIRLRHGK